VRELVNLRHTVYAVDNLCHSRCPNLISRIGHFSEIVVEGIINLGFEPGNSEDLAEKIRYLWGRPGLCRQMGLEGIKLCGNIRRKNITNV